MSDFVVSFRYHIHGKRHSKRIRAMSARMALNILKGKFPTGIQFVSVKA